MLITRLKLKFFGCFQDKEIELKPGINLIHGDNEAGKSTIHTFIRGMLFGIERLRGRGASSKEDTYSKYLPWDNPGAYSGSMDIRLHGKDYRLQRSFHANQKSFTILDLASGREVKLKEDLISELIPGLTESVYKNTISIGQMKARTDGELAAQVQNYIANLSVTKSKEVNVAKAVSILTAQKKEREAFQNMSGLKELKAEIEAGLIAEEKLDQLTIQLRELLAKEQELLQKKQSLDASLNQEEARHMEQLPAVMEKYRLYLDLTGQMDKIDVQIRELTLKIEVAENNQPCEDEIKADKMEAEGIKSKQLDLEQLNFMLQKEQGEISRAYTRTLVISMLPALSAAIIVAVISGFLLPGMIVSTVILGAGGIVFYVLNKRLSAKRKQLQDKFRCLHERKAEEQRKQNLLFQKYGCSRPEELAGRLEEQQKNLYERVHLKMQRKDLETRRIQLEDHRDAIYEGIMKYMQNYIPVEELTSDAMWCLQEDINRRKQQFLQRQEEISGQLEMYRLNIEKLRWEISVLEENEEKLIINQKRYEEIEEQQKKNEEELKAVKLALSSIQELSADIHDSFGHQLNQAVSKVIAGLTQNKYTDLKVDEKLEVKLEWKGNFLPLERLSAGTIDQVFFALRLAVAELLLDQEQLPLLLDDSFALYDDTRVGSTLTWLSKKEQILLFTCHEREQSLLEKLKIPYHFIELSSGL